MSLYILDSDHLSLHQRGHEPLKSWLLSIPPESIAITIISAEELMRGRLAQVRKAVDVQKRVIAYYWLSQTLDFLCSFNVLMYDTQAEAHFQNLRNQKIKIGTQDLKIAAIALSQQAVMVTRNSRDFARVPALKIEDWSVTKGSL